MSVFLVLPHMSCTSEHAHAHMDAHAYTCMHVHIHAHMCRHTLSLPLSPQDRERRKALCYLVVVERGQNIV